MGHSCPWCHRPNDSRLRNKEGIHPPCAKERTRYRFDWATLMSDLDRELFADLIELVEQERLNMGLPRAHLEPREVAARA